MRRGLNLRLEIRRTSLCDFVSHARTGVLIQDGVVKRVPQNQGKCHRRQLLEVEIKDPLLSADDEKSDFWMSGDYIYHHHVVSHRQLSILVTSSAPTPLKNIGVNRQSWT